MVWLSLVSFRATPMYIIVSQFKSILNMLLNQSHSVNWICFTLCRSDMLFFSNERDMLVRWSGATGVRPP